jgi:hypothetical protein
MRFPFPKLSAFVLVMLLLVSSLISLGVVSEQVSARIDSNGVSYNGNQELMADPIRTVFYHGDAGNLLVWNYAADTTVSVSLGGTTVRSLDLSPDGSRVAVAVDDFIAIVNVTAAPVLEASIDATYGNTVSVRFIDDNMLVVSYESSPNIATVDLQTSAVGTPIDAGIFPVLEVSDDGTTVLAFAIGSAASTVVKRYSVSGGTLTFDQESSSLGGFFSQASVDWSGGRIYLACTDRTAVQVLNLGDLGQLSSLPLDGSPSGVARSRDGKVVYGVATGGDYPSGSSVLCAYDSGSGEILSKRYLSYSAGPIAPSADPWTVATASPLRLEGAGPIIEGTAPEDGEKFAYTPSYVQFTVSNDPAIEASDIIATIEGQTYEAVRVASNTFQANLTTPLVPGEHIVNLTVSWGSYSVPGSWRFISGSTDADAMSPSLTPVSPPSGYTSNATPGQIVVRVAMPSPPPISPAVTITVKGLTLNAVQDAVNTSDYTAALPTGLDLAGSNTAVGSVIVEGRIFNTTWSFDVIPIPGPGADFVVVAYGDNFSIPSPVSWTVQRDSGDYELVLTGPSYDGVVTVVSVDIVSDAAVRSDYDYINTFAQDLLQDEISAGHPSEMVGPINDTAISNLIAGVWKIRWTDGGQQEALALIVDEVGEVRWLVRCTSADTAFISLWPVFEQMISGVEIESAGQTDVEVPPPAQGYAYYRMMDDYQLMVPDNWTIKREGPTGMDNVSMWAVGPEVEGLNVDIVLQAGSEPSLAAEGNDLIYLVEDKFIPELQSQGIDASVYEDPRMVNISGLPTLTFVLRLDGLLASSSVIQEVFLIVDGGRYWMITCSTPEGAYPTYQPIFDTVAQSFTVLSPSMPSSVSNELFSEPGMWVLALGLGAVTVAAIGALLVIYRIRRKGAT